MQTQTETPPLAALQGPPEDPKIELLGMPLKKLEDLLEGFGEKRFRAVQLAEWIYKKKSWDFESMTNLSKSLREKLKRHCRVSLLTVARRQVSRRDGTTKYLFRCPDGELVESVYLPHEGRRTACLSTQVGCAMGCRFCATGDSGFSRHLSSWEIVAQVLGIEADQGLELDNLVYMGMGEPMHNWEGTRESLATLLDPAGRGFGPRHVTVSTCGVVPGILKLAESGLGARLAVSLHAPDDATRGALMPVNDRYPLRELMGACRAYQEKTGLQLTFEYTLFAGQNDGVGDARALAALLKGLECKVNLIPYNPVAGLPHQAPDFQAVAAFQTELKRLGLSAMLRTEKGGDIDAACGQLRRRSLEAGGAAKEDGSDG